MSDRRIVAWHIQAQSQAGTRYIVIDPDDRDTTIGSVVDAGEGVYSVEAFGPQPRDSRKSRLYAGWSHYGGTVDEAKADCLNTIRDFWHVGGLAIETAAAAPV